MITSQIKQGGKQKRENQVLSFLQKKIMKNLTDGWYLVQEYRDDEGWHIAESSYGSYWDMAKRLYSLEDDDNNYYRLRYDKDFDVPEGEHDIKVRKLSPEELIEIIKFHCSGLNPENQKQIFEKGIKELYPNLTEGDLEEYKKSFDQPNNIEKQAAVSSKKKSKTR